jgi:hypothetical protein
MTDKVSQKRIQLQDEEGAPTGKWFDPAKATEWEEATWWNGNNHISRATGSQWEHETLYRTAGGAWVLHHWSQWQGSTESYTLVSASEAAAWLVRCEHEPPAELSQYVNESEV